MAIKDLRLSRGRQRVKAFEALSWAMRRSTKNHSDRAYRQAADKAN